MRLIIHAPQKTRKSAQTVDIDTIIEHLSEMARMMSTKLTLLSEKLETTTQQSN